MAAGDFHSEGEENEEEKEEEGIYGRGEIWGADPKFLQQRDISDGDQWGTFLSIPRWTGQKMTRKFSCFSLTKIAYVAIFGRKKETLCCKHL